MLTFTWPLKFDKNKTVTVEYILYTNTNFTGN